MSIPVGQFKVSWIRIKPQRGTAQQWSTMNPVPTDQQLCLETDTGKVKFGNGVTRWNDLPYHGTIWSPAWGPSPLST